MFLYRSKCTISVETNLAKAVIFFFLTPVLVSAVEKRDLEDSIERSCILKAFRRYFQSKVFISQLVLFIINHSNSRHSRLRNQCFVYAMVTALRLCVCQFSHSCIKRPSFMETKSKFFFLVQISSELRKALYAQKQ